MAAPIGAAAGFITASVGVGAAAVQVPLLTAGWTLALPHVVATSTGMASMLAGAFGAAYKYSAADTVDPVVAGSLALPAMATSVVGAKIASALPSQTLKLIWGCVAMAAASGAVYTSRPKPRPAGGSGRPALPDPSGAGGAWPAWATADGFAARLDRVPWAERAQHMCAGAGVGVLNGLLGVGGTPFVMSYLALATDMTQHQVLGTTMVAVIPGVMTGVATHAMLGNIHTTVLPLLCAGSMGGAAVGAGVSLTTDELLLKRLFAGVMVVVAGSVLRSAVRGGGLRALPLVGHRF